MLRTRLAATALAATALPVATTAAAPWQTTQIATSSRFLDPPWLLADPAGAVTLMTNRSPGGYPTACKNGPNPQGLLAIPGTPPTVVRTKAEIVAKPVALPDGRVAVLTAARLCDRPGFPPVRLRLHVGPPATVLRTPGEVIARVAVYDEGSLGMSGNARGDLAVWWTRPRTKTGLQGRLQLRPTGGPRRTYRVGPASFTVWGPSGHALVVAALEDRSYGPIFVTVRSAPPGGALGSAQRVGRTRNGYVLDAAVGPDGAAVVAWGSQYADEGEFGPYTVRAALRAPSATRFAAAQVLERDGRNEDPAGRVYTGIDGTGTHVVWSFPAADRSFPVRVAEAPPSGQFGPATTALPNTRIDDVTFGDDGRIALLHVPQRSSGVGLFAAVRLGPGQPFTSLGALTKTDVGTGTVQFAAAGQRLVAGWSGARTTDEVGNPTPPGLLKLSTFDVP